mmetsp:Transcript_5885/g.17583  ORF Transcript_5885/g.17583 Transcript_5885/m.17583 type:complete len:235 (+) Transcript_5885:724-1428(+)
MEFHHAHLHAVVQPVDVGDEFAPVHVRPELLPFVDHLLLPLHQRCLQPFVGNGLVHLCLLQDLVEDRGLRDFVKGMAEHLVEFESLRNESSRKLRLPVIVQDVVQILLRLHVLHDLGMQEVDAVLVRKAGTQEAIPSKVRSGTPRDDFAVRPVGLLRVRAESVFEGRSIDGGLDEVVEEHGVDACTGKAAVPHEVRGGLLVADKRKHVSSRFIVEPHRSVVDVMTDWESCQRHL